MDNRQGFIENVEKENTSRNEQFSWKKCHSDAEGQRRMAELVQDDREATLNQRPT